MPVKSSTELMLYVVLTMPTLNKAYLLFIYKKISNILSNTESETNRNAFQQTYLVKPPQILQPVALLMFRVEAIPMFLFTVPIQICQVKLVQCFTTWSSITTLYNKTWTTWQLGKKCGVCSFIQKNASH